MPCTFHRQTIRIRSSREAEAAEIPIRNENINLEETFSPGGLCRVEGKYILILNSSAIIKEKYRC